jgi:hypothetical protein
MKLAERNHEIFFCAMSAEEHNSFRADRVSWFEIGLVHQNNGEHEEAILAFTKFLDEDPLHAEALLRRGASLLSMGIFDLSAEDFMTLQEMMGPDQHIPIVYHSLSKSANFRYPR